MPPKAAAPQPDQTDQTAAAPDVSEAAVASPAPSQEPDQGGTFVNVGSVLVEIPFTGIPASPTAALKPGRVVDLAYTPTHRWLKPATAEDIAASRAADLADAKAAEAAATATPGQEP